MKIFISSALSLACLAVSVQAHGYISQPKATYEPNTIYTTYNAEITASVNAGFDGIYNRSPEENVAAFTADWPNTGYSSLREMLDPYATTCGYSLTTGDPVEVSGLTSMKWQNDEYKEGFIASHRGPCEAWIDDTKLFHYDDCYKEFPSYPAEIPTDYSACKAGDECIFTFYWLALHSSNWQIYKQCVPITNANGTGASDTTTDESAASVGDEATETPETEAPATETPETEAPVTETPETETPTTEAPVTEAPATEAPAAETPAPSSTSSNCARRMRRN